MDWLHTPGEASPNGFFAVDGQPVCAAFEQDTVKNSGKQPNVILTDQPNRV